MYNLKQKFSHFKYLSSRENETASKFMFFDDLISQKGLDKWEIYWPSLVKTFIVYNEEA